jgi:hypothetical protein
MPSIHLEGVAGLHRLRGAGGAGEDYITWVQCEDHLAVVPLCLPMSLRVAKKRAAIPAALLIVQNSL